MAVGLNADGDLVQRIGIGDTSISDGGFTNWTAMVWAKRPSTATHATMAGGGIIHVSAAAREVILGFDNSGSAVTHPQLFLTNPGDGLNLVFSGAHQPPFDEWVFFVVSDTSAYITARWRTLTDPTWHIVGGSNPGAGSQYVNNLVFGSANGHVAAGDYAYARVFGEGMTEAQIDACVMSVLPVGLEWGFWPLDTNTDLTDKSGFGRSLSSGGSLITETSPTLDTPPANRFTAPTVWVAAGSVNNTSITTAAIDTTGCTLLIVGVVSYQGVAAPTPTDSKGNIFVLVASRTPPTHSRTELWMCYHPIVGSGHTFTVNGGVNSYPSVAAYGYVNDVMPLLVDVSDSNTNPSAVGVLQTGQVAPNDDHELIVTLFSQASYSVVSISSGFTINGNIPGQAGQCYTLGMAWKIQNVRAAENPTWTTGGTAEATAVIVAFKSIRGTYQALQIAGDDSDAVQTDGTTTCDAEEVVPFAIGTGTPSNTPDRHFAFYFNEVYVEQFGVIHSAVLQLTKVGAESGQLLATAFCEDADDASALDGDLSTLVKTSASTPIADTIAEVDGSLRNVNITSAIHQVANRLGWTTGDAMMVLIVGDGASSAAKDYASFGSDPDHAARLFLDWSPMVFGPTNATPESFVQAFPKPVLRQRQRA